MRYMPTTSTSALGAHVCRVKGRALDQPPGVVGDKIKNKCRLIDVMCNTSLALGHDSRRYRSRVAVISGMLQRDDRMVRTATLVWVGVEHKTCAFMAWKNAAGKYSNFGDCCSGSRRDIFFRLEEDALGQGQLVHFARLPADCTSEPENMGPRGRSRRPPTKPRV